LTIGAGVGAGAETNRFGSEHYGNVSEKGIPLKDKGKKERRKGKK
jgi:hypothetical protein